MELPTSGVIEVPVDFEGNGFLSIDAQSKPTGVERQANATDFNMGLFERPILKESFLSQFLMAMKEVVPLDRCEHAKGDLLCVQVPIQSFNVYTANERLSYLHRESFAGLTSVERPFLDPINNPEKLVGEFELRNLS